MNNIEYKSPTASNLSRTQIEQLARSFSKKINYDYRKGNLEDLISNSESKIVYVDDFEELSNASITVDGENEYTIRLSNFTNPELQIVSIAHELGHYVLHSRLGEIQIKARFSREKTLIEKEADCFANELLMPEEDLRKSFAKNKSIFYLASIFSVSPLTMYHRCSSLGLLNEYRK